MDERVERIHVGRFLEGAWYDDPKVQRVDGVNIEIRHLTGWVNNSGLRVVWPRAEGAETNEFAVVTAKTLLSFTTDHDGFGVRLTACFVSPYGRCIEDSTDLVTVACGRISSRQR